MKALMLLPLILAAAIGLARAEEASPDQIDGYRTAELVPMLPGKIDDLQLLEAESDDQAHRVRARYRVAGKEATADVTIYSPQGVSGPIEDEAGALALAIGEVEKAMGGRGIKGVRRELTTAGGEAALCISGEQEPGKIYYSYCAAVAKGRLMAIQTFSPMEGRDVATILTAVNSFTGQMVDAVATGS